MPEANSILILENGWRLLFNENELLVQIQEDSVKIRNLTIPYSDIYALHTPHFDATTGGLV